MTTVSRPLALAVACALLLISLFGLTQFGLIGPDEPRYASIGREMAHSGDWITPRLWGSAWFEKPALLYWLVAAGFKAGLSTEAAPRLPVALLSIAFLVFLFLWARREFNTVVGALAAVMLGTSAMWLAFGHSGVTDIPLAVCFGAAMLLLLPAVEGRPVPAMAAAALLGCAVLAKGLVPLVLFLPFLVFAWRYWRFWLRPSAVAVFLAVTVPWYALCTWRNGPDFLRVFFWEHQFGRFTSDALQHVRPVWFYLPWLVAALFPSVFLAVFAGAPRLYADRRRQFLLATVGWGLLFFSLSRNKLPGYLLPLLPFAFLLIAMGVDAARDLWPQRLAQMTALSMIATPGFVLAGGLLPRALGGGTRDLYPVDLQTAGRMAETVPLVIVAALGSLFLTRTRALLLLLGLVVAGWFYVEMAALPWVDQFASARSVWQDLAAPKNQFCVGPVSRSWRYGLNYYAGSPLPDCPSGRTSSAILPNANPAARPVVR